jgi:hypothetical protein
MTNFLIIKPTRCTNFWNLFSKWNSSCFGQFLCPSSGAIHCTHSNGICHTDSFRAAAGSGWNSVPSWSCSKAVYKPVWHIPLLSVQWITPDDGQRNCPKHVAFHFENKFQKLVHLVGFIVRKSYSCIRRFSKAFGTVLLNTSVFKYLLYWDTLFQFPKYINLNSLGYLLFFLFIQSQFHYFLLNPVQTKPNHARG